MSIKWWQANSSSINMLISYRVHYTKKKIDDQFTTNPYVCAGVLVTVPFIYLLSSSSTKKKLCVNKTTR